MSNQHAQSEKDAGPELARDGPAPSTEQEPIGEQGYRLADHPDEAPPTRLFQAGDGKPPAPPPPVATGGMDDDSEGSRPGDEFRVGEDAPLDLSDTVGGPVEGEQVTAGRLFDEMPEPASSPVAVLGSEEPEPTLRGDRLWIGLASVGIAAAALALVAIILPMTGGGNLVDMLVSTK